MPFNYRFTWKFYVGVFFVIFSFILGKITTALFIIYFYDTVLRFLSLLIYIISWPMLIIGAWWVGQEYYKEIKRYVSYRFYHEQVKEKTKNAYHRTKALGLKVRERLQNKRDEMMGRIRTRKRSTKS